MGAGERIGHVRDAGRAAWARSGRGLRLALGAAAITAGLRWAAGAAPEWTESLYSRGLYPGVQRAQSALSGLSPVSLGELLLGGLLALVLVRVTRLCIAAARRVPDRLERALRELLRLAALACWIWFVYVFAWSFNYARLPYAHGTGLDVRAATAEELDAAAREWLGRASELRAGLREDPDGVVALATELRDLRETIAKAYERAGELDPRLVGPRPVLRASVASAWMTAAGISGIYWPFTGEPHVNSLPPAPQRLFSALHEVAHQRGFAREDEANYIAVLVGVSSGDRELAYSVALMAFLQLHRSLALADGELAAALALERPEGLLRDSKAISEFWKPRSKAATRVREVSTAVNDTYLKSQGQKQGVRSYGRMVDLLIAERRARLASPSTR